jgi:hypothetical protein
MIRWWLVSAGCSDRVAASGVRAGNFFQSIKCNRGVAMRFEKLTANFLGMVQLAAILVWLALFADTP